MPTLEIDKTYSRPEDQEQYRRTLQEIRGQEGVLRALVETFVEPLRFPRKSAVPAWIVKWAKEFEKDACTLEEARQISRKFKRPLSDEVIAERDERR